MKFWPKVLFNGSKVYSRLFGIINECLRSEYYLLHLLLLSSEINLSETTFEDLFTLEIYKNKFRKHSRNSLTAKDGTEQLFR